MAHIERNQEATVYIGNLDERCSESLVWELMLQAGPVGNSRHLLKTVKQMKLIIYSKCSFTQGSSNTDTSKLWFCRVFDRRRRRLCNEDYEPSAFIW